MKTNFILLFLLITGSVFNSCSNAQEQKTRSLLTAQEFNAKIKEVENPMVIDVRSPAEFSEGHLENAKNIDWKG